MNAAPKISVIVPVYNNESLLTKCVQSILQQTFVDFELLLINDGSTDASGKLCDELSQKDKRIIVAHQKNLGVSAARNHGIEHSKGEYIVFVDSDDWVRENYLINLLDDTIDKQGRGLVIQGFKSYDPKGNWLGDDKCFYSTSSTSPNMIGKMIEECDLGECGFPFSKLYNRNLIVEYGIQFDERICFCEDLIFMYDYLLHADYLILGDAQEYVYIKYSSSLSSLLHSFDMEYLCFMEYQKRLQQLSKHFDFVWYDSPKMVKAMMKCFQRALKTDYQTYRIKAISFKKRMEHLKLLVETNIEVMRRFYHPVCKSDKVGKCLLERSCFVVYDIYIRFLFRLGFIPIFRGPVEKKNNTAML